MKLPPQIIFKGAESGKVRKEVVGAVGHLDSIGVCCVTTTMNGWQTGESFLAWVKKFLASETNELFVLDLFAAHRDASFINWCKEQGVNMPFVPGGCTSLVQV